MIDPGSLGDATQEHRDLAAAADQADVARVGAQRGLEHAFVERVAAGEDDDEVLAARDDARERLFGELAAEHLGCARKAGGVGELGAVVDHHARETDFSRERRDPFSHVSRAVEEQPRRGPDDVDQHRDFAAALHPEQIGLRHRIGGERLGAVAAGGQREAQEPRGAVAGEQHFRVGDDRRLERAAADRARDRAVGRDQHLRAGVARGRAIGRGDGAERVRFARLRAARALGEELGVAERFRWAVHDALALPASPPPADALSNEAERLTARL